jgi:hypothetical protein
MLLDLFSGTYYSAHLLVFPISTYHTSVSTAKQLTEETANLIIF